MGRHLLLQSVLGHLALLAEKHPTKAASAVARKAKCCIRSEMRRTANRKA